MAESLSKAQRLANRRVAEETALAHRGLRAQLERIERAITDGDMRLGARLLNDLIGQARDHFMSEEAIAMSMGLSTTAGGRFMHDAFVERASSLMKRCQRTPANSNSDGQNDLKDELTLLMSDLVESDLRFERNISQSVES